MDDVEYARERRRNRLNGRITGEIRLRLTLHNNSYTMEVIYIYIYMSHAEVFFRV